MTTASLELLSHIRATLYAKLRRLLERPLIARIEANRPDAPPRGPDDTPARFRSLLDDDEDAVEPLEASSEGTLTLPVIIDYADAWRDREKEVAATFDGALESPVVFLTEEQHRMLVQAPRELLALRPGPVQVTLVGYRRENIGGRERVLEVTVTPPPTGMAHHRYVAILPQLVSIERQLVALHEIESAEPGGRLSPLRVLVGLPGASMPSCGREMVRRDRIDGIDLDVHQLECVEKAMATPHFSVIHGPPGSGKTKVVAAIVQSALSAGERVLVVSPTHVAIDNVVERLVAPTKDPDTLKLHTLPTRYAARIKKLSTLARTYAVGPSRDERSKTIVARLQRRLVAAVPCAGDLFALMSSRPGEGELSSAINRRASVVLGTTLGVLAYEPLKCGDAFDLVIVDEASKMTLPEFLAIAVKGRRWVVVGDPAQLPPFANAEENAVALDDLIPSVIELACSVASYVGRTPPARRHEKKLLVVTTDGENALRAIEAQRQSTGGAAVPVTVVRSTPDRDALHAEIARHSEPHRELVVLVERGLGLDRASLPVGTHVVAPRHRAPAVLLEKLAAIHHAEAWAQRTGIHLRSTERQDCLLGALPSAAGVELAARIAILTMSVFEWLTGMPSSDAPMLADAARLPPAPLIEAVRPFVGTLRKQYRMHPSLSRAPRRLFYFDEALHDGSRDDDKRSRLDLCQVEGSNDRAESNQEEAREIGRLVRRLDERTAELGERTSVMVITPYGEQRELLVSVLAELRLPSLEVSICTLDSCQGREADWVFLSLVKSRSTAFMDSPKRWNVAITRAKERLVIVGHVASYMSEAASARHRARASGGSPRMSVLAAVIEACDEARSAAR